MAHKAQPSKIVQATQELADKISTLLTAKARSLEEIYRFIKPYLPQYNLQPFEAEIVAGNLCGRSYSC